MKKLITNLFFSSCLLLSGGLMGQDFMQSPQNFNGVLLTAGAVGDIDNDGDLDIFYTGKLENNELKSVMLINENGILTEAPNTFDGFQRGSAVWLDYDNDGVLDLLVTGKLKDGVETKLYRGSLIEGETRFEEIETNLPGVFDSDMAINDVNNDGYPDIAICGETGDGSFISQIYLNKHMSNGMFEELESVSLPGVRLGTIDWFDYDNDGDNDLLLTGEDAFFNFPNDIYENVDGNRFVRTQNFVGLMFTGADIGDFDNDGDFDLCVSGETMNAQYTTELLINDNSKFRNLQGNFYNTMNGSVRFGDYDADQQLDILVTGVSDRNVFTSVIYDGNEVKSIASDFTGVALRSNGFWFDVDNDEDLDVFFIGGKANAIPTAVLYTNEVNNTNATNAPVSVNYEIIGSTLRIKWSVNPLDEGKNLSFNVSIDDYSNEQIIVNSYSNDDGSRKILNWGNAGKNRFFDLPLTTSIIESGVTVQVQSVSSSKIGSPFSEKLAIELMGRVTSADELSENEQYVIYPNPARSVVSVSGIRQTVHLDVFSIEGKLVNSKDLSVDNNQIDLAGLISGTYLFRLTEESGDAITRLVVVE